MDSEVFIYFLLAVKCNRIKIGATASPSARIYALSTSCPDDVRLLGLMPAKKNSEQDLHRMFRKFRVQGEWFDADQSIFDYIKAHCSEETILTARARNVVSLHAQRRAHSRRMQLMEEQIRSKEKELDGLYQRKLEHLEQLCTWNEPISSPAWKHFDTAISDAEKELKNLSRTTGIRIKKFRHLRKQLAAEQGAARAA